MQNQGFMIQRICYNSDSRIARMEDLTANWNNPSHLITLIFLQYSIVKNEVGPVLSWSPFYGELPKLALKVQGIGNLALNWFQKNVIP
jgi:hypothetical protein